MLIVEDDPGVRTLMRSAMTLPELADLGPVRVLTAADAESAIGLLDGRAPDLVLLDLALPGEDGLTWCRRLKADPRLRQTPVVAVSALGVAAEVRERARAAGCDAYLAKPFDLDELVAVVRSWLRP